jgi:hypothetical protein
LQLGNIKSALSRGKENDEATNNNTTEIAARPKFGRGRPIFPHIHYFVGGAG